MGNARSAGLRIWGREEHGSDLHGYHLMYFLTACRKQIVLPLPLAVRKAKLVLPYPLPDLTVQRAQLVLTALPQDKRVNIPGLGIRC